MQSCFNALLVVLTTMFSLWGAELNFSIHYKNDSPRIADVAIKDLVSGALQKELNEHSYIKAEVNVYTVAGGAVDYLIVYLLRSDIYLASGYISGDGLSLEV